MVFIHSNLQKKNIINYYLGISYKTFLSSSIFSIATPINDIETEWYTKVLIITLRYNYVYANSVCGLCFAQRATIYSMQICSSIDAFLSSIQNLVTYIINININ